MNQRNGITPEGAWLLKHWALGLSSLVSFGGLFLAVPGNEVAWRAYQQTDKLLGVEYKMDEYYRADAVPPKKYQLIAILPDAKGLKGLGASLMLVGSTVLFMSANALKKEYERLELTNWAIRKSEFELTDYEYEQSVEVDRYAIDLQYQQQISDMLNPPTSYHPEDTPQDQPKLQAEPEFSKTATGYLAWLQQKAAKLGNSFEVRWCCQQSFAGSKPTKAEVTGWVDELIAGGQTEWLDEEKKTFRLQG